LSNLNRFLKFSKFFHSWKSHEIPTIVAVGLERSEDLDKTWIIFGASFVLISILKCPYLPIHIHWDVDGCIVSNTEVLAMPDVQQALLLFVNFTHSQLINWLLDDNAYLVVNQIEV